MTRPEKYIIRLKEAVDNPALVRVFQWSLASERYPLPSESNIPPERDEQVAEMVKVLDQFGREELRVDLSATLPTRDHIRFLNRETYNSVSLKQDPDRYGGETFPTGDMAVVELPSIDDTLANANHELLHSATPKVAKVTDNTTELERHDLLYRGRPLPLFTEALVVTTDLELRANAWETNPVLSQHRTGNIGYLEAVILKEELIKAVAKHHGVDPVRGVLRPLQRGLLLAQPDATDILADALGSQRMQVLLDWTRDNPVETMQVARELNLREAQKKIEALNKGQAVSWFETFYPSGITTQTHE